MEVAGGSNDLCQSITTQCNDDDQSGKPAQPFVGEAAHNLMVLGGYFPVFALFVVPVPQLDLQHEQAFRSMAIGSAWLMWQ